MARVPPQSSLGIMGARPLAPYMPNTTRDMDAKCKSMDDEAIKGVASVCRLEFDADHEYDIRRLRFSTADKIGD